MSTCRRESTDNHYVPLGRTTDEMAGKTPRRFGLPEALVIVTVAMAILANLLPTVKSSPGSNELRRHSRDNRLNTIAPLRITLPGTSGRNTERLGNIAPPECRTILLNRSLNESDPH